MAKTNISEEIRVIVEDNDIALFMKGTKEQPMCGFSGVVVDILKHNGVNFVTVNVLENEEIRQGIKEFSDWPTIPQLYIKQEFIGGCDIVREMHKSGELLALLRQKNLVL